MFHKLPDVENVQQFVLTIKIKFIVYNKVQILY